MNTVDLLFLLRSHRIQLWVENDQLRYSAPKGGITDDLLAEIRKNKVELLNLVKNTERFRQAVSLSPVERTGNLRPSFAQERLWFLTQLEPGDTAYHISGGIRLEGKLRVDNLEQSLTEIVSRHEALRTTFEEIDGKPVQVISPAAAFNLPVLGVEALPEADRAARLQQIIADEARRPFDLAAGPLFRAVLVQLGQQEHVLVVVMHHIITDGWSLGVFTRELESLYSAFCEGRPSPLADLPVQYADYAAWQRERLQGEVLDTQVKYWRQKFGEELPILQLSTDRPRPAVQTHQGSRHGFDLPEGLSKRIEDLSRQQGVTLYMMLLAAFKVLLYRYTGQADFGVGSPIANRTLPELEGLIGFFVNTLVLRTDMSGDPGFIELLSRVRETTLGAFDHQELPFEKLVEVVNPAREMSYSPLFQVTFVLQNMPRAKVQLPGLKLSSVAVDGGASMFDMTLFMWERDQRLSGSVEYNTDLFDAERIERMAGHFQTLLEGIVANPARRLSELPILTEAQRHELLVEWNNTQTSYPRHSTIHQLFEVQVERTPDAIAVVFGDQQLHYRELNDRANKLANHLRKWGAGPDVCVGLCMERSVEMIVAILGILKAGGAYVPLDPEYPPERLAFILSDIQAPVLLTQQSLMGRLPEQAERIICLDTDWATIEQEDGTEPTADTNARNLAYIIYTSGSTGKPKGVMIPHAAICNHMLWMLKEFAFGQSERVLQKTPFTFDASVWEFYAPLISGGQLVMAKPEGHRDSTYLVNAIIDYNINTLQVVPSQLQMLLNEKRFENCLTLRRVFCGGEALTVELFNQFMARLPSVELINLYGPSEATIDTTFWRCHQQHDRPIMPIGRPIGNMQVYILDPYLNPVPVGVQGELHIAGPGIGRGYLNRPDLTAEKFVSNPFPSSIFTRGGPRNGEDKMGGRLYKSGDLARYLPNGIIEFIGRSDYQVKIRGFRIELGEVESVLGRHPAVEETVVIAREDVPGDKRLVAYVVASHEPTPTFSELRSFLKEKLPDYMIPSAFVYLDSLPLTPNGKVDRRALPTPDGVRPELDAAYQVPRGGVEQTLAQIWKQVLRIDQVGRQDNFFELGGDSILSIQIVAKANQAGLRVTPRHLFQYQTIAELAEVVEALEPVTAEQGVVTGPLPLSPIQHWFFGQQLEEPNHWNMAWVLEAKQPVDPKKMEQVVEALLRHHDALRLRFVPHSTGWKQELGAPNQAVPFTFIDLSHLPYAEAAVAFSQEADRLHTTLNLSEGPLIQVALFKFSENQADRVLLVIHHLAVDGISWRILLDDLQTAYDQLCERGSIQLPPKTTSLKEWTEGLVAYAQSNKLLEEVSYWGAVANTPCTNFPRDFVDGINTVASTQAVSVVLGREDTQALLQEIPEVYHTQINDVLLTALVDVLAQWSQQETVCLDLEGHGREELLEDIDLSRTVGWFTSIFPLVLKRGNPGHPGELLKSVKEQLRQIPHRGIGYGLLRYVGESGKVRDQLGGGLDPEVAFNYLGQFDQVIPVDGRWRWSRASGGANRHPQEKQTHLISINARIMNSVLQVQWSYSEAVHRRETIETLANNYLAALVTIIRHCQSPEAGGYTPSDFPLARVSQSDLDKALIGTKSGDGKAVLSDLYPLTPLQQGLWFHALLDPESGVYFEQSVLRIEGFLNRDVFRRAWEEVLARHAILRTRIIWEGLDHPLQFVQSTVELPWAEQDWRGSPDNEHQSRLLNFLDADRVQGFDLTQAPLMRLTLLQVAETSAILVWSFHHLILDRWSVDVVQQEVWSAYQALVQGRPLQFNSLRPYREYIGWLQDQDLNRAEQYWRHLLSGFTAPTVLGVDLAPPTRVGHQESSYNSEKVTLSEADTSALSRWSRQQQLTVNTVVQGAWALLLSRYSATEDVVFGTTLSGRSGGLPGIESMVGLFINTLPVRVHVSPSHSVAGWLTALQEQQVTLREYEYTPLFEIQKWSEVPPGEPLFNILLVFENIPLESQGNLMAGTAGLNTQRVAGSRGGETNYPLTVVVVPGRTLQVRFTYDTEHYTAEAITRMVGHFQQVLAGMVGGTEQQLLGAVPLLTETERQQLLGEWNATETAYPREATLAERFEAQVAATPDAVAVVFGEDTVSYDELNTRANLLAHYLQHQYGVGPEVCVGLCLERSLEMVVGLLGILKAGGGYVPLDPNYPQERLAFMAKDADLRVILTQEKFQEHLSHLGAEHIRLDADWPVIGQEEESTPVSEARADSLAYVIYTSGSTGRPKGVQVTHANVVRLFLATEAWYHFNEKDVWTLFHSYAFDFSVWELWGAFFYGGRVVIVPYELSRSPEEFYKLLVKEQVTILNQTPSAFHQLIRAEDTLGASPHLALRYIIFGGEALDLQSLKPWFERHGDQMPQLVNMYGITETTVHVTYQPLSSGYLASGSVIGRPISDLQVYILDRNLEPVPIGLPGELYVGGAGVARGYLNRPDLTAERFIAHPFSETSQARLYKTGDRGRFLSDGVIEYLGRMDNQVQLRGFRIELGEIEAVLAQHPMVAGAVAVVREDEAGEKRLVGYVVPAQEAVSTSELRQFLKQTLPAYMLPAAFVVLEELPLTPNGKVDRRGLPAPDGVRPELDAVYQAPRGGVEQTLAQIWKQVLRIDQVGRQDNFFELGGDSILSIQIVAKANPAGLRVTPRHIFQYQTIAELAEVVEALEQVTADQGVVTGPLPLSPIQHWFFGQQLEEPNHWNMTWVLEAKQPLDPKKMEQVVEALLGHHDALRLRFVPHSTGWKQELGAPNQAVPFTFIDLSHLPYAEAAVAFSQEADRLHTTLNLSEGPLIQVALFKFSENQADRVLLVIHHLAVDGISWRILLDDLQTAYDQLCERGSIQLPPKTTSLKEWTEGLVAYAQSNKLLEEVSYWGAVANTPCTNFPRDFVDGINTVASTQAVSVVLGREDTQALLQEIPEVYHTQINDVLLTALVDVLAQWSQQETVCLDLEGHGREELLEDIDLSRTVGWFTSIFPLVLKRGNPGHPGELLKSVKEQLRQIPHRGIGYGLLRYVGESGKVRDQLGGGLDPEVAFNYLGQFDQVIPVDGRWRWSRASGGANRHPQEKQTHLISINARIMNSVLQVHWSYSEAVHRRETIETLANNYLAALVTIIRHCQSPEAGGYTPSDFPLARVSQSDLDKALIGTKSGDGKAVLSDLYPLTPLQQGLWFHALLDPESGVYFEQSVLRIEGFLNRDVFRRAWEEVLARHAILRTRIIWEGLDHPLQFVQSTVELPWAEQDWRGSPDNEHQSRLLNFLDADRVQGFDLTQAPLMRLTLLQVAETSAILVWSFHHLILDRWSVDVVQQEVWSAYQALVQGRPLQFNSLRPYREYIGWLQDQDLNRAEQYWRHLLRGFTEPTVLGVDQAPSTRAGHQESWYDFEDVTLSEAATSALSRWARQQQLTVNTVVQGTLAVLLSRYSGSEDVVFGATVSGRSAGLPGIETMVGLFINALPARVHVSPIHSVVPWLTELQEQQVSLREYEYTPLFEIQKWSEVPPGAPLFNTLLVFENTPQKSNENLMAGTAGLHVQGVAGRRGGETNYSLTMVVVPGRTLQVRFTYDTEHYTAEAITRMVGHFQQVLAGMVGGTEQQLLGAVPLLTETERDKLLVEWNDTVVEYPRDKCIHELFENQVERTPDAAAVIFGKQRLTYRELNTRANKLAHYLQSQGVVAESRVGIWMDRSLDMMVALLGTLKAGGAYVPLDPSYPQERLAFMLEDAQAPVLLTMEKFLEDLPAYAGHVVCMDKDFEAIAGGSEENPISGITADSAAYVIYTSGSTGTPKGVIGLHRGAVNRLSWMWRVYPFKDGEVCCQKTYLSFVDSVWEIFGPLLKGVPAVIIPDEVVKDPPLLVDNLAAAHVSRILLVPSLLRVLLDSIGDLQKRLFDLKIWVSSGEEISVELAQRFGQVMPEAKLINLYGSSEVSADVTCYEVADGMPDRCIPIGRPIDNASIYILDSYLQPLPIGVPGELYIGGVGLARGYLNQPDLTSERFIPSPFGQEEVLFKTGDLGRYLPEGNIEYLGRRDHQVKVRGFRIELGEIESQIKGLEAVSNCVVVLREDRPADQRLTAYYVCKEGQAVSESEVRRQLQAKLPEYMLPQHFMELSSIPLTPNGKVDRKALPKPETDSSLEQGYVAPRTEAEQKIAAIWQKVLNREKVGVLDDFFELGGHSLLATQVMSRINRLFNIQLPLRRFFEARTVEALAEVIDISLWNAQGLQKPGITGTEEREVIEL